MNPIYLDYNATTPIDKEVAEAMRPFLDQYFGNPSSVHEFGIQTKKAVIKARSQVADLLGCQPDEIIFTSGGTESNNFAIKGIALANKDKGKHIITSAVEHPAVIEVCKYLESEGFEITYLDVDDYGRVSPASVEKAIRPDTILISVMHANNEVGTIQPISEIAEIAKKNKVHFHCDAAQSIGKIPVKVNALGVDLLSVAGHKLYAPKGIGALYVRRGIKLQKLIHGADHEMNQRAGTENVLEIAGLGEACAIAGRDLAENAKRMKQTRDLLFEKLTGALLDARRNGHPEFCLPNTLSMSFPGVEANTLLSELQEVAASAGAACHTDSIDISSVLQAMKVPEEFAMGTIRFSTGRHTTLEEIDKAADHIIKAVNRLKPQAGDVVTPLEIPGNIKLTRYTHGLGCACKIRPQYLEKVLQGFAAIDDPNVLVSLNSSDDAAVYRINESTAIIQSVDFFTPIVDDPYQFGAIAAANALSDIYAMGGKPLFALNIVGFPDNRLPVEVLQQILKGASDKAAEAGIYILGGHTIEDPEPKFGMAVTGIIHPDKILANNTAKPGDVLILTKPIGTGIIATAMKRGLADEQTSKAAIKAMSALNNEAANIMSNFNISACTDITGFGLLGHLKEMTVSAGVNAEIYAKQVPLIPGASELCSGGIVPGGTQNNLEFVKNIVKWDTSISETEKLLLCDAQTSGGLLIAIPEEKAEALLHELLNANLTAPSIIGKITVKGEGNIFVRK